MSDVDIKYKSQTIASMDASGTKTLETDGTYCESDIVVEYTKPSGADVSEVTATEADVVSPKKFVNSSGVLKNGGLLITNVIYTPSSLPDIKNAETNEAYKSVTIQKPSTLTAENIKDGVTILGVTGSYTGVSGRIGSEVSFQFSDATTGIITLSTTNLIGFYAYDYYDIDCNTKYSGNRKVVKSIFFQSPSYITVVCGHCDSIGYISDIETVSNPAYGISVDVSNKYINITLYQDGDFIAQDTNNWRLIPIYAK